MRAMSGSGGAAGARRSEFFRFAFVGTFAAGVDAGVLALAIEGAGLDPYAGRVVSYLAAATFAWAFNRWLTFRDAHRGGIVWQWLRYLSSGLAGGLVNYGVYSLIVAASQNLDLPALMKALAPYVAVGFGSLLGLVINFTLARTLVFRRAAPQARQ